MIDKLKKQIKELEDKIVEIQKECSHPKSCMEEYPYPYSASQWEDDEYSGHFSTRVIQGKQYKCGLCGYNLYTDDKGNKIEEAYYK